MIIKTIENNINDHISTFDSNLKLPIKACHTHSIHKKPIHVIEYLSSSVMYDKVGRSRLIIHLKEVLVSNNVYVDCNLKCGVSLLIEKMLRPEAVIRNIKKNALNI